MEKEIYNIQCLEKEEEKNALIELIENEDYVEILFSIEEVLIKKKGENYFETLQELRKELEKKDIKLLCKGCSKNVYPSGMLLNMGTGRKAYALSYGKQAKMDSLVDIFEPCLIEEYGTISQQLEFFENWTNSLGEK